jgi:hypothetical protein
MPFGLISEEACKQQLERVRAAHRRDVARLIADHEKEIESLRKLISESGIIKSRGRQPGRHEDRYTIQVYADAKLLHTLIHSTDKTMMVKMLSEQFMHEARQMLLALSGLERIPVVPYRPEHFEDWYELEKRQ